MWFKTIQQDLKSKNLSLNKVINMAQNCVDYCLRFAKHTHKKEKQDVGIT